MIDAPMGSGERVDTQRLDAALADLVARGRLDARQADEVRGAYVASEAVAGPAEPIAPQGLRARRDRLIEGAGYLGAVFVAASLLVLVGQRWTDLSTVGQVGLLLLLAAAAAVSGAVVLRGVAGGRSALRTARHAARRRVVSVLLTLAAVLAAASLGVALGDRSITALAVAVTALALLVLVEWVAPSALTELGMFVATVVAAASFVDLVVPDPSTASLDDPDAGPPLVDYVLPATFVAVGLCWALVVARRLTVPLLGVGLGLVVAFMTALPAAGDPVLRAWGLTLLAALAVIGLVVHLRGGAWPWLALVVVSTTAFVALLVRQAAGPAVAFLVAGVLLLGLAALGARSGRRGGAAR